MTLRSRLLAAGLVAALLPGLAVAQSIRSGGAPAPLTDAVSETTETPTPAPGLRAACTADQQLNQTAAASAAYGNIAGKQELGQSFVAPCDGNLNVVTLTLQQPGTPGSIAYGFLKVYDGAGTAGTLLDSKPFRIANTPAGFATQYPLYSNAAVLTGQTYTFFVDLVKDSTLIQGTNTAPDGPYLGGTAYSTQNGDPASAGSVASIDLTFRLTFNATTVTQASAFNGPGWRLLSPPVDIVTIQELAQQNLVQGYLSQFPTAGVNLYQNYAGGGTSGFRAPTATGSAAAAFALSQGRGFFWYWYDQDIQTDSTLFGGGTSDSRELTGFVISATGRASSSNAFLRTQAQYNADGLYMLGNPFRFPLAVSGITRTGPATGGGTLGTTFFVYDPAIANYRSLFVTNPTTGVADYVAVWQGLFGQVSGATATTAPQFGYNFSLTSPTATPPFYGRGTPTPYVQLMLNGTTASGTELHDVTAYVRFTANGQTGWDTDDASKLALPPDVGFALLAPVGVNETGARTRLAVNSLPAATLSPVTVPVDFTATEGGTFTVSWAGVDALPSGWSAMLTDAVTGTSTDLTAATTYAFSADATAWTERFALTIAPRGTVAGETGAAAVRVGPMTPNPTAGTARVALSVDAAQTVRAVVVDALGREVAVVFEGVVAPGAEVSLDVETARLTPGTYVVRIEGETFAETRRLTVVR